MDDKHVDLVALENAAKTLEGKDWEWWTSNSYRRLTFKEGQHRRDGGALHATTQRADNWPDVAMAPGVQEFIERASPKAVLAMAERIAELEAALRPFARAHKDWDGIGCFPEMTIGYMGREAGEDVLLTFGDLGRAATALDCGPAKVEGTEQETTVHDDEGWTPITTDPPCPGQYETRVMVGERYRRVSLRHWDGHRWLSRNGLAGTVFGVPSGAVSQDWRVPTSRQELVVSAGDPAGTGAPVLKEGL